MKELNENNFEKNIKEKKNSVVLFMDNNIENLANITIKNHMEFLEEYSNGKINFFYVVLDRNPELKHFKETLKLTNSNCFVCSIKKYKNEYIIEDFLIDIQPLEKYLEMVNKLLKKEMPEELKKLFNINEKGEYIYES